MTSSSGSDTPNQSGRAESKAAKRLPSQDAETAPSAQPSAPRPSSGPGAAQSDIASFVLRFTQDLWRDAAGEPHLRWRGHIRHVQSDADARFTEFADAVAFMRAQLARLTEASVAEAPEADRESVMLASLEIWERFAQTSAEVLAEALKASVDRGESLGREAYDLWTQGLEFWKPLAGAWGLGGLAAGGTRATDAEAAGMDGPEGGAAPAGTGRESESEREQRDLADRAAILEAMAKTQRQLDGLAESLARLDAEERPG